jgi:hypothetical protein
MKAKALKSGQKTSTIPSIRKLIPTTKIGKKMKVKKVMDEWKHGELKTNAGKVVKYQKQAVAIALSESGQSYKDKKKNGTK